MKKSIYVTGIVKDSKKNMEKYLFSENERLNAIIDELEDLNEDYLTENFLLNVKINKAIEYLKENEQIFIALIGTHYYKILEILGVDDNEKT